MGVLTTNGPPTFVDSGLAGDGGTAGSPIDDGDGGRSGGAWWWTSAVNLEGLV